MEEAQQQGDRAQVPVPGVLVAQREQRRIETTGHLEADAGVDRHEGREALPVLARARAAPARRVHVEHRLVRRHGLLVPEAEPLRGAGPHVVVHGVGPLHELPHDRASFLGLEVHGDRALAGLTGVERRVPAAQPVAAQCLELDHVGPEVGEESGGERPGVEDPGIEHPHAVEQRTGVGLPPARRGSPRRAVRERRALIGADLRRRRPDTAGCRAEARCRSRSVAPGRAPGRPLRRPSGCAASAVRRTPRPSGARA